ncbi:MAG: tetratricopeptide repeat protein, partial [Bacteroidota bacterium]
AEKRFGKAHHLYLEIQETLIEYFVSSKFLEKQEKDQKKLQLEFLERNKERRQSNFQIWDINQSSRLYYGKNHYQYAFTQRLVAKQALKRQNSELAVNTLKPLYDDHSILPLHHPTRTDAALVLYEAEIQRGKLDSARSYLTDYLDLSKEIYGESSLDYALAQQKMGSFLFRFTNEFDESKRLLDASSSVIQAKVSAAQKHNIQVLNDWVEYYEVVDNYPKAVSYADQALEVVEKHYGKDHPRYASQLVRKADLLMLESQYAEVDSIMKKALFIFDEEFNPNLNLEYATALETAANFNAVMGLYDEAESQLQKARNQVFLHAGLTAFLRKRDDNVAFSENADQLAFLYIQSEEYERAGTLLNEIIDRRIETYGENSRFLISPYTQLARLRRIEGEYTKADEYIEKARQIAEDNYGVGSVKVTPALEVLADIQTSIGDYESAKGYAQKALEIKTKALGENNIDLANTYVRLAIIKYYNKEEWSEVEKLLTKAEVVTREGLGQQNPIYAGVLQKTASIYLETGETSRAEENLLRARDIWLTLGTEARKKIADIDVLIAQVDIRQGDLMDAEDKLEEALTDYKKIFSKTHPDYIRTKSALAKLYFKMGDYKKTQKNIDYVLDDHKRFIEENFPVLSDREKSKAWGLRRDDFEFFTYFATQTKDDDLIEDLYNNVLITKSVLLSASKGVRNKILNSGNDSLIANYERWTELKSDLVKAYGLPQDQLKEAGIDVKTLQADVNNLEKSLS